MSLQQWITNPHSEYSLIYCHSKVLSQEEFIRYVKHLEEKTGLNLMAESEGETLHGFVSMSKQAGICHWGEHTGSEHSSVIVSLYTRSKEKEEFGSSHEFEALIITDELKQSLEEAHNSFL